MKSTCEFDEKSDDKLDTKNLFKRARNTQKYQTYRKWPKIVGNGQKLSKSNK